MAVSLPSAPDCFGDLTMQRDAELIGRVVRNIHTGAKATIVATETVGNIRVTTLNPSWGSGRWGVTPWRNHWTITRKGTFVFTL